MGLYKYSVQLPGKNGSAQAYDLNASYKDLTQVCKAVRRKSVEQARKVLEECIELKKAIPYSQHNKGMGHRSELNGKKGRYPKKEARIVLGLVNDAAANAKYRGLDDKKLFVSHAAAYKQNSMKRYRRQWAGGVVLGYGKQATASNYETARVELLVSERQEKKAE